MPVGDQAGNMPWRGSGGCPAHRRHGPDFPLMQATPPAQKAIRRLSEDQLGAISPIGSCVSCVKPVPLRRTIQMFQFPPRFEAKAMRSPSETRLHLVRRVAGELRDRVAIDGKKCCRRPGNSARGGENEGASVGADVRIKVPSDGGKVLAGNLTVGATRRATRPARDRRGRAHAAWPAARQGNLRALNRT